MILFWYCDNRMLEIWAQNINIFANVLCQISMHIAILTLILPSGNNLRGQKKPVNTGLFEPWCSSWQRFGNRISLFSRKKLSDFKWSQVALFAFWIFLGWFQKRFLQRDEWKWLVFRFPYIWVWFWSQIPQTEINMLHIPSKTHQSIFWNLDSGTDLSNLCRTCIPWQTLWRLLW